METLVADFDSRFHTTDVVEIEMHPCDRKECRAVDQMMEVGTAGTENPALFFGS